MRRIVGLFLLASLAFCSVGFKPTNVPNGLGVGEAIRPYNDGQVTYNLEIECDTLKATTLNVDNLSLDEITATTINATYVDMGSSGTVKIGYDNSVLGQLLLGGSKSTFITTGADIPAYIYTTNGGGSGIPFNSAGNIVLDSPHYGGVIGLMAGGENVGYINSSGLALASGNIVQLNSGFYTYQIGSSPDDYFYIKQSTAGNIIEGSTSIVSINVPLSVSGSITGGALSATTGTFSGTLDGTKRVNISNTEITGTAPILNFIKNRGGGTSGGADDIMSIEANFLNNAGTPETILGVQIFGEITSVVDGAEGAELTLRHYIAGTKVDALKLDSSGATFAGDVSVGGGISGTTGIFSGQVNIGTRLYFSGTDAIRIGSNASLVATQTDTIVGIDAGGNIEATGYRNSLFGNSSGKLITTGDDNTNVGYRSGQALTTTSFGVNIGSNAGKYETVGQKLFIDGLDRTDEATARTNSLIYGVFHATPASQTLALNAQVSVLSNLSVGGTNVTIANDTNPYLKIHDTSDTSGLVIQQSGKNTTIKNEEAGTMKFLAYDGDEMLSFTADGDATFLDDVSVGGGISATTGTFSGAINTASGISQLVNTGSGVNVVPLILRNNTTTAGSEAGIAFISTTATATGGSIVNGLITGVRNGGMKFYTNTLAIPTDDSGLVLTLNADNSATFAGGISATRVREAVTTITSSATPTINIDNCAYVTITALGEEISSINIEGTPINFDKLTFRILDDGSSRAITWGDSFQAMGVALPTTTTAGKVLIVGFVYDSVDSKWGCVASVEES